MALNKEQKERQIKDLRFKISKQKAVVFADFNKVPSKDMFVLRKKLKEAGCILKIAKKTLTRIAFGQSDISFWNKAKNNIPGQLAIVFGVDDEINPAKISNQFAKTQENFKILGGLFQNRFIDKDRVLALANLPSKQELLGKLVGSIASPMSGFVTVLQGNIKGLITILSKIKK